MKIKSFSMIALVAMSFTLMSFSSGASDTYGEAYSVQYLDSGSKNGTEAEFTAAALRLTAAATRRALVFTAEVTRVALPAVEETIIQASTVVIADNVDKHSKEYIASIDIIKDQKLRQLG